MQPTDVEMLKVFPVNGRSVVHVPQGRGEELREHLASHGISSEVSSLAEATFDRLELGADVDPETVQTIVDEWES